MRFQLSRRPAAQLGHLLGGQAVQVCQGLLGVGKPLIRDTCTRPRPCLASPLSETQRGSHPCQREPAPQPRAAERGRCSQPAGGGMARTHSTHTVSALLRRPPRCPWRTRVTGGPAEPKRHGCTHTRVCTSAAAFRSEGSLRVLLMGSDSSEGKASPNVNGWKGKDINLEPSCPTSGPSPVPGPCSFQALGTRWKLDGCSGLAQAFRRTQHPTQAPPSGPRPLGAFRGGSRAGPRSLWDRKNLRQMEASRPGEERRVNVLDGIFPSLTLK